MGAWKDCNITALKSVVYGRKWIWKYGRSKRFTPVEMGKIHVEKTVLFFFFLQEAQCKCNYDFPYRGNLYHFSQDSNDTKDWWGTRKFWIYLCVYSCICHHEWLLWSQLLKPSVGFNSPWYNEALQNDNSSWHSIKENNRSGMNMLRFLSALYNWFIKRNSRGREKQDKPLWKVIKDMNTWEG